MGYDGGMDEDILPLVTTRELAGILKVDPRTISRWVISGRLVPVTRTPGGHLRFSQAQVRELTHARPAV